MENVREGDQTEEVVAVRSESRCDRRAICRQERYVQWSVVYILKLSGVLLTFCEKLNIFFFRKLLMWSVIVIHRHTSVVIFCLYKNTRKCVGTT